MTYSSMLAGEVEAFCAQEEVRVLDCRDPRSYEQGHMPGAQLISDAVIQRLARSSKQLPVLVYCYHGVSSRDLAEFLVKYGFTKVFNLEGGWQAWLEHRNQLAVTLSVKFHKWLNAQGFAPGDLNSRGENGMTLLMRAAMLAETAFVRMLLEAGADVNLLNDDLNNALWFACVSESAEIISQLVEYGININNRNINGATCLIYAASAGKFDVVRQLVEAGTDLSLVTQDGFTALDSASTIAVLRYLKRQPVAA